MIQSSGFALRPHHEGFLTNTEITVNSSTVRIPTPSEVLSVVDVPITEIYGEKSEAGIGDSQEEVDANQEEKERERCINKEGENVEKTHQVTAENGDIEDDVSTGMVNKDNSGKNKEQENEVTCENNSNADNEHQHDEGENMEENEKLVNEGDGGGNKLTEMIENGPKEKEEMKKRSERKNKGIAAKKYEGGKEDLKEGKKKGGNKNMTEEQAKINKVTVGDRGDETEDIRQYYENKIEAENQNFRTIRNNLNIKIKDLNEEITKLKRQISTARDAPVQEKKEYKRKNQDLTDEI